MLSWLQPRKNNCVPTELDVSISAIVKGLCWQKTCWEAKIKRFNKIILKKEAKIKIVKSITTDQNQELTLEKMKDKEIGIGSGVTDKKYEREEIYELIHIANCLPELREKSKVNN